MSKIKEWLSKLFDSVKISGIPFFIALVGAYSGSEGTSLLWRRVCIPLIFVAYTAFKTHSWWSLILMSIWGWLSIGYGIPDYKIPRNYMEKELDANIFNIEFDDGSTLGRFWFKIFKGNHFLTDIFTRGTIGFGISLSFLVIPILTGNWFSYFLGSLGIISVYAFNSHKGYGQYIFEYNNKKYYLNKVDIITYAVLGACGIFIIG